MDTPFANVEMAAAWDGEEGTDWARDWERYDRTNSGYQRRLEATAAITATDRVLDVGCGNGYSTRAAARAAPGGWALGVDLSTRMLERARGLAAEQGITNARFDHADAQAHPFDPAGFDLVISRFGSMFFGDPVAAFGNLAQATAPRGRLVLVAWRDVAHNEWIQEVRAAFDAGRNLPSPPPGAPSPFAQADPGIVERVLTTAGWTNVGFESAEEPVWLGGDADDAFGFISNGGVARGMLAGLSDGDRTDALDALRVTLAAHETPDGVIYQSSAWVISATRPA